MKRLLVTALAVLAVATPTALFAWGGAGHRIIGDLVVKALPAEVPAFLRTKQAAIEIGELSREPDRSRGAGKLHDQDRDPGHFVDLDENGKLLGGPPMLPLAATRADYETQLRAAGLDQWKTGYLPYSIIDRYQQLTQDFGYWRVLAAAEKNNAWKANRAWFRQDRLRREALILKGIGELSHYVGDGSQPLHVTSHFNGWGDGPNPKGYTTARIHAAFEGELVRASVTPQAVAAKMAPFKSCGCPIEQRVGTYLTTTGSFVEPLYELEKVGGLKIGDPRGAALAAERMAVGASEVRDLVVEAWRASADIKVGWRPIAVQDVLSGKVDPYPALYSVD